MAEARLNRQVSLLKESADAEMAEIKAKTEAYAKELAQYRQTLKNEVDLLESRREASLKPILDTQKEANEMLKKAEVILKDAKTESDALFAKNKSEKEANLDHAEALRDKEDKIDVFQEKLIKREGRIVDEESRLKYSSIKLSQKWADLHEATTKTNAHIADRELKIQLTESAFEVQKIEMDKREADQDARDRAIADKYATLIRTTERLKK